MIGYIVFFSWDYSDQKGEKYGLFKTPTDLRSSLRFDDDFDHTFLLSINEEKHEEIVMDSLLNDDDTDVDELYKLYNCYNEFSSPRQFPRQHGNSVIQSDPVAYEYINPLPKLRMNVDKLESIERNGPFHSSIFSSLMKGNNKKSADKEMNIDVDELYNLYNGNDEFSSPPQLPHKYRHPTVESNNVAYWNSNPLFEIKERPDQLESIKKNEPFYNSIFSHLTKGNTKKKENSNMDTDDDLYNLYIRNDEFSSPPELLHKYNHLAVHRENVHDVKKNVQNIAGDADELHGLYNCNDELSSPTQLLHKYRHPVVERNNVGYEFSNPLSEVKEKPRMNADQLESTQRKEPFNSSIFSNLMKVNKKKSTDQEMNINVDDELYDMYNCNDEFSTPHPLQNENSQSSNQRSTVSFENNDSVFQCSIPYDNPSLLVEHVVPQSSLPALLNDKGDDMLVTDQFDQAIGPIFGENDSRISIAYRYLLKNHVYMSMFDKQSLILNNHTIHWTRVVLRIVIFLFVTTLIYGYILSENMLSMISVTTIIVVVILTMIIAIPLILLFQHLLSSYCLHYPNFSRQTTTYSTPDADNSLRRKGCYSDGRVDDDVYCDDLLSVDDEVDRLFEARLMWVDYNSPDNTSTDSDERAVKRATIQSIQQSIGISSDGSAIPLSFMDWLQFGTSRKKLIAKIESVRRRADLIRTALTNACIDENSKEIILIQHFILEQFDTTKLKQNILNAQLFPSLLLPSSVESSLMSPISWCCAWLVIVLSIVFFFYFIIQWGLTHQGGSTTFWLWILNFALCLTLDMIVVQSIYTYAMYIIMMKSIIPQLKQIRHVLSSNVATISNKQNLSNEIHTKCNVLSNLSPVYRSISSRSPSVITTSIYAQAILAISDDALLQCRDHE